VTESDVKKTFKEHLDYYQEHLGVLKGAKPEDVTCKANGELSADQTVFCSECKIHGFPDEASMECVCSVQKGEILISRNGKTRLT